MVGGGGHFLEIHSEARRWTVNKCKVGDVDVLERGRDRELVWLVL